MNANQTGQRDERSANPQLDGKEMVAEAMNKIGARRSNIDDILGNKDTGIPSENTSKDLPALPQTAQSRLPVVEVEEPQPSQEQAIESVTSPTLEETAPAPPPKPPRKPEEDPELKAMIKSITEMGFTIEQARGALIISNRNLDHAINILLEEPEKIPRLLLAKQKLEAMKELKSKENAKRSARAQSSPQQPHPSLVNNSTPGSTQDLRPPSRPTERSVSISSPRPVIGGTIQGAPAGSSSLSPPSQKPWSPIPFLQNQTNALLTNNTNPSVKKFSGWLNKAIENLGRDDEENNGPESFQSMSISTSNLDESFTVVLGSSHSKVTHNLRLLVFNPEEVFPSGRIRTQQDVAIHAQTAASLYGHNLTGLVQLVNIRDWAKYKGGQVCHQEFFKACQSSTELHFDSVEKQLEALETKFPLDGSTLREGDFFITRHSNLPMIHVVFHLFYGQYSPTSPPTTTSSSSANGSGNSSPPTHQPAMFSQSSEFTPKADFLAGLKNIVRTSHRYEITMLSLPFLMMPVTFETQLVASVSFESNASSSSSSATASRHIRHSSSTVPTSTSGGPFASSPPISKAHHGQNSSNDNNTVYSFTDQTRRDLQRRSEILLRNLKSYLMDNARQLKQVGNQGSDAEKFRASQGGDVMVVQFMLPKGTNDDMFRTFRSLLVNIFGVA
ncbi:hypothetical protein BGZ76_002279 [Entomortierella beljakovae]|nr:hypothetical protein BGZ76_002279 [Entomortierella beljakovae]